MMIFNKGNILEAKAEALVNTVNCVGIMGRGVALQFRKTFPENYKFYKKVCERNELYPGKMLVFETGALVPRFIINFPTKRHWKAKSRVDDIQNGLNALIQEVRERKIKSIAIPPLGCGLGGLNWSEIKPLIVKAFDSLPDVEVFLYQPLQGGQKLFVAPKTAMPEMTVGRATLLGLMQRYLIASMDPVVTLLELHKLMYFMQEAGEPLNLRYAKAPYGPYAENLRHVLNVINGHFIFGFEDSNESPTKQIQIKPESLPLFEEFLKKHPQTLERFDRVVELIEGFETAYGMELLATVHWVATREKALDAEQALQKTYAWNERKSMFKKDDIEIAWKTLLEKQWLPNLQT